MMTRIQALLGLLMEECDEVSQRASKAQRFGVEEVQRGQEHPRTNGERIMGETIDFVAVYEMLSEATGGQVPSMEEVLKRRGFIEQKKRKVEKYLDYSIELGQVEPRK